MNIVYIQSRNMKIKSVKLLVLLIIILNDFKQNPIMFEISIIKNAPDETFNISFVGHPCEDTHRL